MGTDVDITRGEGWSIPANGTSFGQVTILRPLSGTIPQSGAYRLPTAIAHLPGAGFPPTGALQPNIGTNWRCSCVPHRHQIKSRRHPQYCRIHRKSHILYIMVVGCCRSLFPTILFGCYFILFLWRSSTHPRRKLSVLFAVPESSGQSPCSSGRSDAGAGWSVHPSRA